MSVNELNPQPTHFFGNNHKQKIGSLTGSASIGGFGYHGSNNNMGLYLMSIDMINTYPTKPLLPGGPITGWFSGGTTANGGLAQSNSTTKISGLNISASFSYKLAENSFIEASVSHSPVLSSTTSNIKLDENPKIHNQNASFVIPDVKYFTYLTDAKNMTLADAYEYGGQNFSQLPVDNTKNIFSAKPSIYLGLRQNFETNTNFSFDLAAGASFGNGFHPSGRATISYNPENSNLSFYGGASVVLGKKRVLDTDKVENIYVGAIADNFVKTGNNLLANMEDYLNREIKNKELSTFYQNNPNAGQIARAIHRAHVEVGESALSQLAGATREGVSSSASLYAGAQLNLDRFVIGAEIAVQRFGKQAGGAEIIHNTPTNHTTGYTGINQGYSEGFAPSVSLKASVPLDHVADLFRKNPTRCPKL